MKFRLQVLMTMGVLCLAFGAEARSWRIELDGSGDFTDIQPAVDAAAAGDTLRIGPGRFDTFHQCIAPAWVEDVIVWVTKDNLTFIGSGEDVTILGPAEFYLPSGKHPKVFCSFGGYSSNISEMTIENVETGVMWERNQLDIRSCLFRGQDLRFFALYLFVDNGSVSDCVFELPSGGSAIGILNSLNNVQGLEINRCTIRGAEYGISVAYGAPNISIQDCELQVTYWGIAFNQQSSGLIGRCHISGAQDRSVLASNGSIIGISDSEFDGSRLGLAASGGSSIIASGVIVSNTTEAAVSMSSRAQVSVSGSHLLPASGMAVNCGASIGSPMTIDLTGNYWGTTSSTAIEALIHDSQDDATNLYTVLFAPFANGPVPTEATSWGDLKALWR